MKKKLHIVTSISFVSLVVSLILPNITYGSQTSTIVITRTPYLSFSNLADPFSFNSYTVQASDGAIYSDPAVNLNSGTGLPDARKIVVTDTRNSGGFTLQANATDFTGAAGTISKNNLRIVTTSGFNSDPSASILKIIYQDGFSGEQGIDTPLDAGPSADFGSTITFTEAAYSSSNSFSGEVDLMNGCLSSTQGRSGQMAIGVSFYLAIPKFQPPGTYDSTITYTLLDNTSPSC